jgi:hypothetical protein
MQQKPHFLHSVQTRRGKKSEVNSERQYAVKATKGCFTLTLFHLLKIKIIDAEHISQRTFLNVLQT